MNEFTIEALLGLYSVPSIGPTRMRKLISVFKTPQAVLDADIRRIMNVEGICLLYTSPSPRDVEESRMPSSA